MNKILSAFDFSPAASNATEYAIEISKINKAQMILLHAVFVEVLDPVTPAFYLDPLVNDQMQISGEKLNQLKEVLQKKSPGIPDITVETRVGLPSEVISSTAKDENADLIVTGAKGNDWLTDLLGSTNTDLVNSSDVPILIVPEVARFKPITKVVFATNFQEGDLGILEKLLQFLHAFQAEITILHVDDSSDEEADSKWEHFTNRVSERFSNSGYEIKYKYIQLKHIAEVIGIVASIDNADLIVMTRHPRGFWGELFHKSVIAGEIKKTEIPLLIYR